MEPGWYGEPGDPHMMRWWDGRQWTPATRPAQTAPGRRIPTAWFAATVLTATIAVAGVVVLETKPWASDSNSPAPSTQSSTSSAPITGGRSSPALITRALRHTAVERYIEAAFSSTAVVCNDGMDIPVVVDGTFSCTAGDGRHFTVKMIGAFGKYEVTVP